MAGWRERWAAWRNRRLADPAFRRAAMAFAPTRGVARGHADALFGLVTGFVHSQTLAAFVELGWHGALARPARAEELPGGLEAAAAERLLRAAEGLGLAERVGAAWTLGPRGAALAGDPGVVAMVRHHARLYRDLADPVALLRRGGGGGELAALWSYAGAREGGAVADYSALMAASQPMVAEQALAAYPFARHRRLMDVGGGEGAFLRALAAHAPSVALTLVDLPDVVARAPAGMATVACDFRREALPAGHDCATLVRVLHDHDDAAAEALLRAVARALAPGGRVVIVEPMAGRPTAAVGTYFELYLLAMGAGRPRAPGEYVAILRRAGFGRPRVHATPLPLAARVMSASVISG